MNRRAFLAAAAAPKLALAQEKQRIGIAFLGLTHAHAAAKLRIVRQSPDWQLAGACEADPAVRASLEKQKVPLLAREELLSRPDIAVVAVESAVRDHARDGLAVVRAGKHLHLEKAPAANLRDFKAIVKVASEKKLLLQTGYMWRYHPGVAKMLEAAREGWLGRIYMVRAMIGNQLEAARRPEWAEFAGGVMFELGGHVLEPLVRLLGRPDRISPHLRTDGAADRLRDNTLTILEWKGAIGVVQAVTLQPSSSRFRSIELHGANGTATLRPIEPPQLEIILDKPAGPFASGANSVPMPEYRRYVDDLAELAAAVRGERPLRTSLDDDLLLHEVLLKASGMA
jgi:predicted dehydrogenase